MTMYRSFTPAILGFLLWSAPASLMAQSGETGNVCVRDFRSGAVCTANDVRIEALVPQTVIEDCASGVVGETEVMFKVLVSADGSPDRFDIGLFLALDGGSARDGDSCFHDFLVPPLSATPTLGDANMDGIMDIDGGPWLDGDSDGCGDIGTNTQVLKVLQTLRFACVDNNMDGSVDVSVCTSWDNNAGTVCNDLSGAFPGTNSKCSCDAVELGIPPIVPMPGLTVTKSPATQTVVSGGSAVFTLTVDNSGDVDLTSVVVSDPQCTTLTGPTGDTNTNNVLETTETWSYTCTVTNVTSGFTNTATVTATPPTGPNVSDSDTADVTVDAPSLTVSKDPPSQAVLSGGSAVFTITVDNSGDVALSSVVVDDPQCTTLTGPTGDTNTNNVLETTETWSYTCTVTNATSGFTNTATVTATPPTGPDVSDSDTADVTVSSPDAPAVSALKTSALFLDNDGSGTLTPGDSLEYTIVIDNGGSGDALDVIFTDFPDPNTTLVVGSVIASQGTVTTGNGGGDTTVVVDIGTLVASGQVTVTFEVDIDDPFPDGVSIVSNQGLVSGSNFSDVPTDDPGTLPNDDPTEDVIAGTLPAGIPTVSEWGLILLALVLALLAIGRMRRRRPAATGDERIS